MNDDFDADDLGSDMEPHEHAQDGIKRACLAIINKDDLSVRDKLAKLKQFLTAGEKLAPDADDEEPDEDDEDDDADMDASGKGKPGFAESVRRLLRLGKNQRHLAERRQVRPATLTPGSFKAKHFRR